MRRIRLLVVRGAVASLVGLVTLTVPPGAPATGVTAPGPSASTLEPGLRYPLVMPATGKVESLVGGGCPSARSHVGVDVSSPLLTAAEIRAAYAGFATAADSGNGYGLLVDIVHAGGAYLTRYAHLSRAFVGPEGRWVEQGEPIGMMGATGNAQIVHLHFELRSGNGTVIDLNPAFRPCRREVTAGTPIELDVPGLVPALVTWLVAAAVPGASVVDPTVAEASECRYWEREGAPSEPQCSGGDDGDGRRARARRTPAGARDG